MYEVVLTHPADLAGWRAGARALLAAGIPPAMVRWRLADEPADLFAAAPPPPADAPAPAVPRAFVELAAIVIHHRAPERFGLLYRLLWRQVRGERGLLALRTDAEVARTVALAQQVQRDAHHMRAYVRFRESRHEDRPLFLAWFAPEHYVLDLVAPHFIARMGTLRWSILTPAQSAHWDGRRLHYAEGRPEAPPQDEDGMVECWKTYYASIFNPARLKVGTMMAHMPRKYWAAMDETALIPGMVRNAVQRTQAMLEAPPTAPNTKGRGRVCRDTPAAGASPDASPRPFVYGHRTCESSK